MNSKNIPFFIVAPVRSGSTLLRLMLDSHPDVTNPGECDFLLDLVSENGKYPMINEYHEWLSLNRIFQSKNLIIDKYLNYPELMNSFIEQMNPDKKVLTMNIHRHFHRLPKIFPDARYIHLLRDPRDVARSCIGMGWVGNVYYGIRVWEQAEKSWDALKETLKPDQYLEIKYEDLLEDIRMGLTKICNFLDVEYTDVMMDYANNSTYGLPDNSLSYQWKKKYNKRELQYVESVVSNMILERGYELSGYPLAAPGKLEKIILGIKNKTFRIRYQVNKYGLELYTRNLMARKLGFKFWQNECKKRINAIDIRELK